MRNTIKTSIMLYIIEIVPYNSKGLMIVVDFSTVLAFRLELIRIEIYYFRSFYFLYLV
jgi:hypothetical protein